MKYYLQKPIANCNNRDFPEKLIDIIKLKLFIMKIFCLMLLFTFTVGSCFGQTTKSTNTKNDYLKKSRNQKTAALVLLGGGFVVTMVGVGVASNNFWEDIITSKLLKVFVFCSIVYYLTVNKNYFIGHVLDI